MATIEYKEMPVIPKTNSKFLYPKTRDDINFGIYNFEIEEKLEPLFKKINWFITIDISISMADMCQDGKSKIEQIKYTLQKMIKYFLTLNEKYNINQRITIVLFDHEISIISNNEEINENYIKKFEENLIHKLKPNGMTDIGIALDIVKKLICKNDKDEIEICNENNNKTQKTIHIFLTDGEITQGITNIEILKEKIITKNNVSNIFLGFGTEHSDTLLEELASTKNSEYYFVESIEKAGLVYGEVIYNCIYEAIHNLILTIENGEFYDYKKNRWVKMLKIGNLPFSTNKTWHIQTPSRNDDKIARINNKKKITIIANYESILENDVSYNKITDTFEYPEENTIDKDVEKYYWRQRTQELIAETRCFIKKMNYIEEAPRIQHQPRQLQEPVSIQQEQHLYDDNNVSYDSGFIEQSQAYYLNDLEYEENGIEYEENNINDLEYEEIPIIQEPKICEEQSILIEKLDTFLTHLKKYITENKLNDNDFMKNLSDDIYVCIKSINSPLGYMYVSAREKSQGYQRAYNITNYEELTNKYSNEYFTPSTQDYETSKNYTTSYINEMTSQVMWEINS